MNCRFCNTTLNHVVADLGMSPLANSFLDNARLNNMESFYPLKVFICSECLLVQLDEFESPSHIFSNYSYFASYSTTWLKHAEDYANDVVEKFRLDHKSQVVEIASNDGYLLKHFRKKGIPILGIEPAENVAKVAQENGIPTINKFFNLKTAHELAIENKHADFLIAINVMPHVPNLNDFVSGLKILLKPSGIISIQFSAYMPYLLQNREFDAIYHEHFSYFLLLTMQKILSFHGLTIFDVEEIPIHGGSLRIYAKHSQNETFPVSQNVRNLIKKEMDLGLSVVSTYTNFQERIKELKLALWNFFINAKKDGKNIVCYGAAAKGNTLLNYCGISKDLVNYVVDISPHKQGLYLPGTHIPIKTPQEVRNTKPDYLLILAWNLKEEIMEQMSFIREWGGKFVVPIPEVKIYP